MRDIRITGIVGSPRLKKNTDTLVQQTLDGCRSKGASVDTIYLNKLEIKPCQAHKVQDGKGCIMRDGMDVVYEIFEASDGLVLGTPVFYNSVSSQMKLMIKIFQRATGYRRQRASVWKPKWNKILKGIVSCKKNLKQAFIMYQASG